MAGGDNAHNVQYSSILMSGTYGITNRSKTTHHTIPAAAVAVIIITLVATCSLPVIKIGPPLTLSMARTWFCLHCCMITHHYPAHGISRHITPYGVHMTGAEKMFLTGYVSTPVASSQPEPNKQVQFERTFH